MSRNRNEPFQINPVTYFAFVEGSEQLTNVIISILHLLKTWMYFQKMQLQTTGPKVGGPQGQNVHNRDHPTRWSRWFCQDVTSMGLQTGETLINIS